MTWCRSRLNRVTPEASVRAKQTPQSTAPSAVSAAMADVDRWLATALLPLENQLCYDWRTFRTSFPRQRGSIGSS